MRVDATAGLGGFDLINHRACCLGLFSPRSVGICLRIDEHRGSQELRATLNNLNPL